MTHVPVICVFIALYRGSFYYSLRLIPCENIVVELITLNGFNENRKRSSRLMRMRYHRDNIGISHFVAFNAYDLLNSH